MRTKYKKIPRLREMHPTRALAYCANLTAREWSILESSDTIDLWTVFRAYIVNGYNDTNLAVPGHIEAVWGRCKIIIDREAGV